mmetsp:Transcript_10668/g.25415  ORF Transcript_10668/g.25415 Transcript_10668/m.25415 type:complete len:554 (-) Transcript_10668:49-1710(-)
MTPRSFQIRESCNAPQNARRAHSRDQGLCQTSCYESISAGLSQRSHPEMQRNQQDSPHSTSSGFLGSRRTRRSALQGPLALLFLAVSIQTCQSLPGTHSTFNDPSFMAGLGHAKIPTQGGRGGIPEPSARSTMTNPHRAENLAMLDSSSGVKVASAQATPLPFRRKPQHGLADSRQHDKAFGGWRSDLNMVLKSWCAWASRGTTTSLFASPQSTMGHCPVESAESTKKKFPEADKVNAEVESQTLLRIPALMKTVSPPKLSLRSGASNIPHPQKLHRGGEDVHMVAHQDGNTLIGVFDGVGGWADVGVDPALYARQLAAILQREFRRAPTGEPGSERPLQSMLQVAHRELEESQLPGSCTVCLALLKADGELHILNLGDSSLHILRDGVTVFETMEQQHYFNCPFQLGLGSGDQPPDGDYYIVDDLAPTDLIIAATDGLWDNMYEEDVTTLAQNHADPTQLAAQLAIAASIRAQDPRYRSPFAVQAQQNGLRHTGGKLDDISVVAAQAVPGGSVLDREKGAIADVDPDLMGSSVSAPESVEDVDLRHKFKAGL